MPEELCKLSKWEIAAGASCSSLRVDISINHSHTNFPQKHQNSQVDPTFQFIRLQIKIPCLFFFFAKRPPYKSLAISCYHGQLQVFVFPGFLDHPTAAMSSILTDIPFQSSIPYCQRKHALRNRVRTHDHVGNLMRIGVSPRLVLCYVVCLWKTEFDTCLYRVAIYISI